MTDPELTPAQERAVRERLADARHTGPVPDDVVARLDDTLRRLAAEGTELPVIAPVVTLASRRRRTAAAVLVAAAAVVVAGVGIGQVLPTGGGDSASSGAGVAADREFSGEAPEAQQDSGSAGPTDSRRRRTAAAVLVAAAAVVVAGVGIGQVLPTGGGDSASSGAGAAADREFSGAAPEAQQDSGSAGPTDSRRTAGAKTDAPGAAVAGLPTAALSSDGLRRDLRALVDLADTAYDRSTTCDAGDVGAGRLLPVTYDGQEALVVLRTPRAGFRQADVYLCGDDSLVRSVELPAR